MKKVTVSVFIAAIFSVCIFSCKTIPDAQKDYMYVMVYDYHNNGVKNVSIFVDDKKIGSTDVYGRFSFPIADSDEEHKIILSKEKYETIEDAFFYVPNEVLYYKMGESFYYFENAELNFDSEKYDEALKNIEKALEIENRKDYEYLKSLIQGRIQGDDEK